MKITNVIISILFLLFLLVSGFLIYRYFYGEQMATVMVPNIVGMDIYTAKDNLKLVDLNLEVVSSTFSDRPVNVILKQYPEAGTEVRQGSIVKVVISSGKKEAFENIPNFVGKDINQILSDPLVNIFFKKYGLSLEFLYYPSLLVEDKKVIMQVPEKGFPNDKKVTLLVSKKVDVSKIGNYSSLSDFLYNANFDAFVLNINNTDLTNDRIIENVEVQKGSIIAEAVLNYDQIPNMKMSAIYLKVPYSENISFIEVFLSDYLGSRLILKQYYTGSFVTNLQLFYIGKANVYIKINGKKVSGYDLP
ncbi:MAG: PASTA domain-containing protein [bacterium]